MKTSLPLCFLCLGLLTASAAAQQSNEKAARYLEPLLKRPGPGPLFERFVDAWLDSDTLENLQKYLTAKVQAEGTTANRLLLAVYLSRQGETVKSLEHFRAALTKDPGSADIWYQKAVVEARTLDFDSAVASLRKALESKPAAALSLQASQLLGRLLARSGRTDESLKVWQELMAARPEDEELREDVLELQIAEGLNAAAQATAEALVEGAKDPYKRVLRRLRLGDVHDRAGARDKALETYAACLADSGADSWLEKEITAQIEKLFRREDDLSGLKAFYTKLLEKDARRLGLRRAQARLLVEMGETDAAVTAGRELLKLAPGDRAVREEFIALLAGANKLPEAIAQLEALRKQTPKDAELLLRLATLQNDAGKKTEAAALVREFVKLSGDEAARLRASGLLERCGLADEAAAVLREGGEAPALRQALASLLHKNGRKDDALAEWKKLAGGSSTAAMETARALAAHGETEAAWLLLKDHAAKAENDAAFLTALCQTAERTDHAADALPYVRKLVSHATLPADLESALDLAVKLVRKADKAAEITKEVQAAAASAQDFALLAALREEARDSAGAEAALKQAEAASPELAAVLLVRLYTQRADFMQAALALERLFTSPGGRKAHHAQSLTDLWMRAGQMEKALKTAREWRQLSPGSTTPVLMEARLLETEGREKESLEVLRRAAGQFEGNDDIRAQLAGAYRNTGRTADALRIYGSLYENATDLAAKMRWMQPWAQTAEEAGRTRELVEQFEERRRASRDSVVPLLALAEIHRASGSYEGRRKALTEAARLKQNDPELALEIARLEARENNEDAAIRTLRAALPNDKTGAVRQDLVLLLLRSGEREEGLRLLAEGQADALKNPAAVENVAEGLMTRDSEETALAFLTPHLNLHPDDYRLQLLAAMLEEEEYPEASAARLLRVLGQRTELPEARLKAFAKSNSRGMDEEELVLLMQRILPAQALEFFKLSGVVQKMSRQQRRGNQGRQTSVDLPENLEEAHLAAAALLLQGAQANSSGDKAAALITEMERAGFASAALVRSIGISSMGSLYDDNTSKRLIELSAEQPADDTLLSMAVMAKLFDWQNPGSEEIAKRAWERFAKTRPALALLAALPAVGISEKPAVWEDEAMKAAEAVADPEQLLLLAAVRVVGLPYGDAPRDDVNEAVKKRLLVLLQRWYGSTEFHGQNMGQMGGMIFMTLANGFGAAADAEGLAKLLDQEAVRKSGSQLVNYMGNSQNANNVSQALGFPPRGLQLGLPPVILSVLSANDDDYNFFRTMKLEEEALKKAAEKVQHPLVKLLLLVRAGDDEAVRKLLEARLAAPEPEAVSYLLAAGWAERQSEFPRAAELAKKALFLPLSREARKTLDMAFLSWADSDAGSEPVLAAARDAALRMRRDVLSSQARQRLAAVMENLGLTSEAEKLAKQDATAVPGGALSGAAIGGIVGRSSSQPVLTPSGKLLAAGKKNEALPLLTKELTAFGREALKQSGWSGVRGFDEWLSSVKQYAMTPAVMKSVVPAGGDAKALALHGAILDLAGDAKQATEVFKKALAAGSTDAGVKARLFRLVAAAEPKEAANLLEQLPAANRGDVFALLTPEREDPYGSFPHSAYSNPRVHYGASDDYGGFPLTTLSDASEVLDAWLDSAPAANLASAEWLNYALSTLSQQAVIDKSWISPSLYMEKWDSPKVIGSNEYPSDTTSIKSRPAGEMEAREKIKARGAQFDKLLEKLAATPGMACMAWQAMRSRQHFDEKEPLSRKLFKSGIASVLLDIGAQKTDTKPSGEMQSWHSVFSRLLPTAVQTEQLPELETKLLPELRRLTKGKALENLEQSWTLHHCAPAEFAAKAKEVATKSRGAAWNQIMQAASVRRTGAEIADEFLTWLEGKVKSRADIRDASTALTPAVRLVFDLKGREAAEQWMRQAWQRIAGSREERKKSLGAMDEDGNFTGPWEQGITWMAWFTAQLWDDTALLFTALRVYEDEYLTFLPESSREDQWDQNDRGFNTAAAHVSDLLKGSRIQQVTEFLRESPFLGGAAEFRTCGGSDGLFVKIAEALSKADMSTLMQLDIMGSAEKLTFGQSLLAAGIAQNRTTALCNNMSRWQKDIAALPKPQREDLLVVMREWSDTGNSAPDGLSREGQAFRKWLENSGDDEKMAGLDKEVTEFLDPKNLRTLRTGGSYDLESKIRELLELLVKADSPRAWEVVEKVRETALQASRDPERNPLAEAMVRVLNESSSEVKPLCYSIALTLHAAAAPGSGAMPVNWRLLSDLKDAGDDLGRMQRDPVARMKMIADGLAPYLKERQGPLLLPVLAGALRIRMQQTAPPLDQACEAVLTWTQGAGKNHQRQDIVREIAAAARLMKGMVRKPKERKFSGVSTVEKLPEWQQHYFAAMSDEALSPGLRLTLAAFLSDADAWQVEDLLLRQAVALLEQTVKSKVPVPLWQEVMVLEQFNLREDSPPVELGMRLLPIVQAGRSLSRNGDDDLIRRSVKAVFRVALRCKDEAAAGRIARTCGELFDSQFLSIIVRNGTPEIMRAVLRPGRSGLFHERITPGPTNESYDQALEGMFPAVLNPVEQEDLRYLARLAIHALRPKFDSNEAPPAGQRMAALAGEFAKITFKEVALRERALEILASESESAALVADAIKESLEGLPISTIATLRDEEAKRRKKTMYFAALSGGAAQGDFAMLETALSEIIPLVKFERDDFTGLASQCLTAAGTAALRDWEKNPETLTKACAAFRAACARLEFTSKVEGWPRTAQFTALLHALADKTADLDAWWKALPDDIRGRLTRGLESTRMVAMISGGGTRYYNSEPEEIPAYVLPKFGGDKAAASKQRDSVFLRFAASPLSGGALFNIGDFVSSGWGTIDDALRLEEQWCTLAPRGGLTAVRFADYHGDRKNMKAALAAAERGLEVTGPGRNGVPRNLLAWKLYALFELNRATEGTDLFFTAAKMPAVKEPDDEKQKQADDAWEQCAFWASAGPAKQTGSLAEAVKIAALLYDDQKDDPDFWSHLEQSGVFASEVLAKQKRLPEAQAAAAFALKARAGGEKIGGKPGKEFKTRAEAALSGATPGEPLLARDAAWHWLESSADAGDKWRFTGFDDKTWKSGTGPFGFGDDGLKSEISNKGEDGSVLISWPFRAEFDVVDVASMRVLTLNLRVDDGGILWLNGREAGRRNMPNGEVNHLTLAPTPINQADEGRFDPITLDPKLLITGRNTLAVELHQQRPDSSDAAFHAELLHSSGAAAAAVDPANAIQSLAPQLKDWPVELQKAFLP